LEDVKEERKRDGREEKTNRREAKEGGFWSFIVEGRIASI